MNIVIKWQVVMLRVYNTIIVRDYKVNNGD